MSISENPFITVPSVALGRNAISAGILFDDWIVAETEATLALAEWRAASRGGKASAYGAYVAALDAEAAAAAELEQWISAHR